MMANVMHPMSHVRIDLLSIGRNHYLYLMDIYSKWPVCTELRSSTTEAVITVLRDWYETWGWPSLQISDKSQQFNNYEMASFCNELNIIQKFSSPDELNEIDVSRVRSLINECEENESALEEALEEWRNTPNSSTGLAPSELFYREIYYARQ